MKNRLGLKVVSILLGLFAWVYVNLIIPPPVKRTLNAPIIYRNKPYLMRLTPEKSSVEIELKGNRRDFIMSGNEKIQVSVDLYNLRPGKAMFPIKVIPSSGLSVVSIKPAQLEIEALPLLQKEAKISVVTEGEPVEGYIAERPRISPDSVIIEGPEKVIDKIGACEVKVELSQLRNSISESKRIQVYLEDGTLTNEVVTVPDKVSVDVTVKEGYPGKVVFINKPIVINKPPEGFKLKALNISPKEKEISGPTRLLNQVEELNTLPFDLGAIKQTGTYSVRLELPQKKLSFVGSDSISLFIEFEKIKISKKLSGLSFELKKAEEQHVIVSVSSYSMILDGFIDDLDQVRDSNLQIVLDVNDMAPGTYEVPLTVPEGISKKVAVKEIIPGKVKIKITHLATGPENLNEEIAPSQENKEVNEQGKE